MSTKTTIKRVALVAVAAMGFGLLSVVSASAATTSTISQVAGTGDNGAGGIAGPANTLQITVVNGQNGGTLGAYVTISGGTFNGVKSFAPTVVAGATTATISAAQIQDTMTILTTTVGSLVINVYDETAFGSGLFASTPSSTKTITITAASVVGTASAANSTSVIDASTASPHTGVTTDVAIATPGATANVRVGTIKVNIKDTQSTPAIISGATVSVAITGSGLIASSTGSGTNNAYAALGSTARVASSVTDALGNMYVAVYTDGTVGLGTITISVGSTTIATEIVTFTGAAASYSNITAYSLNTIPTGATTANVLNIVALDANGNIVPGKSLTMTSSNTAVIASGTVTSSPTKTAASIALTTLAGTGVVTLTFSDATGTIAATTTAVVTVSSGTISTSVPSLSFDKTSYTAGEKMVLTLSAVDANGLPVPNGVAASSLLTAAVLVSNVALQGFPTGWTATTTDGKITYTVYAPQVGGTVTVTGTGANTAATALSASADISNASTDAATDAANAATDAANYAADAADAATTAAQEATAAAVAAQESADAATAAVVALGLRVDSLLASVRAQLTSIANLIKKILAKK